MTTVVSLVPAAVRQTVYGRRGHQHSLARGRVRGIDSRRPLSRPRRSQIDREWRLAGSVQRLAGQLTAQPARRERHLEHRRLRPRRIHGQERPRHPLRNPRHALLHDRRRHGGAKQQHLRQLEHRHLRRAGDRLVDAGAVPRDGDDGPDAHDHRLRLLSRDQVRMGHGRGR